MNHYKFCNMYYNEHGILDWHENLCVLYMGGKSIWPLMNFVNFLVPKILLIFFQGELCLNHCWDKWKALLCVGCLSFIIIECSTNMVWNTNTQILCFGKRYNRCKWRGRMAKHCWSLTMAQCNDHPRHRHSK